MVIEITLVWEGPYPMDSETPDHLYGKHGVFANVHNKTLYIGKALDSSIFREAKSKANRLVRELKKTGEIGKDASHEKARNYVNKNCFIYLAVIPDEQSEYIDYIERCLIRHVDPPCNKAKHSLDRSVKIFNREVFPEDFTLEFVCKPD